MKWPKRETFSFWFVDIKVARDRKGQFEPELIKKADVSRDIE